MQGVASWIIFSWDLLLVQAIQADPSFIKNVGQIVLLGGAFSVNGNVNPAAEANVSHKWTVFCTFLCCSVPLFYLIYLIVKSFLFVSIGRQDFWRSWCCRYCIHKWSWCSGYRNKRHPSSYFNWYYCTEAFYIQVKKSSISCNYPTSILL